MKTNNLWPIYEFRPLPVFMGNPLYRFNNGDWIPDDGKYDLAFAGRAKEGYPMCLYVSLPYQKNIIWSFLTTQWTTYYNGHPRRNPWHYMLRNGTKEWGGSWGRDIHKNELAGCIGMDFVVSLYRCANGSHIEFNLNDPHIKAGLLRERESGLIIKFPERPKCMYCGYEWEKDLRKPVGATRAGTIQGEKRFEK